MCKSVNLTKSRLDYYNLILNTIAKNTSKLQREQKCLVRGVVRQPPPPRFSPSPLRIGFQMYIVLSLNWLLLDIVPLLFNNRHI